MTAPTRFQRESECDGKRAYRRKADAKRVVKMSMRHGLPKQQAYKCSHCDGFHVGGALLPEPTRKANKAARARQYKTMGTAQ